MEYSKPIKKVDDDAKKLIIEALDGDVTGGFDVDSIYCINGKWYVLEFLKCDTVRPYDSHPNRYWFKNARKFISLWNLRNDLKGDLYLVNYEDSRDQFLIIKVNAINSTKGMISEDTKKTNFQGFKDFFKKLNSCSLMGKDYDA